MRTALRQLGTRLLRGGALLLALGPASASAQEAPASAVEVARQVRELEAAIRHARSRLIFLVSAQRAKSAPPLHAEPELKQLARDLPELEAELERWARYEVGPPSKAGE